MKPKEEKTPKLDQNNKKTVSFDKSYKYPDTYRSSYFARSKALLSKNILRVVRHPGWVFKDEKIKIKSRNELMLNLWTVPLFCFCQDLKFFLVFCFQRFRLYIYSSRLRNNNIFHDCRRESSKSQVWDCQSRNDELFNLWTVFKFHAHWCYLYRNRLHLSRLKLSFSNGFLQQSRNKGKSRVKSWWRRFDDLKKFTRTWSYVMAQSFVMVSLGNFLVFSNHKTSCT